MNEKLSENYSPNKKIKIPCNYLFLLSHKDMSRFILTFCKFVKVTYLIEFRSLCCKVKLKNPTHMGFCSEMPYCQNTFQISYNP